MKKKHDQFIISIDPNHSERLKEKGLVREQADGRVQGISNAVNKALASYLRRV